MSDSYYSWLQSQMADHRPFFPVWIDLKSRLANISPGAFRLYIYLGLSIDRKTGQCFTGVERMARDLGCTTRTIGKHLHELQEKELITRIPSQLFNRPTITSLVPVTLDEDV